MTDEVAELVLENNRAQTLGLMIARRQALPMANVHARYLDQLEADHWLDRALEFLPTDRQIAERQSSGRGLLTPELAVVMAYTKNADVADILLTDLPDDPALGADLAGYFPGPLRERFPERDPEPPAPAGDRHHPAREPDGQPLGHLVRPPHDRGHGRVDERRRQGVDRDARDLRVRRTVAPDRGAE